MHNAPAQSLKVIYSEDPAALQAMTELLLLQEQARSMARAADSAHRRQARVLAADAATPRDERSAERAGDELLARAGGALPVGSDVRGTRLARAARAPCWVALTPALWGAQESLQKLALKRDPRTETLWCALVRAPVAAGAAGDAALQARRSLTGVAPPLPQGDVMARADAGPAHLAVRARRRLRCVHSQLPLVC